MSTRQKHARIDVKLSTFLKRLGELHKQIDDVRKAGAALDDELERIGDAIDELSVAGQVALSTPGAPK